MFGQKRLLSLASRSSRFGPEFQDDSDRANRAVVVGDAGEEFRYASLNRAFRELIAGASLIALAKNRSFKDADGKLSLDAGAFVAALEFASQRTALVLGKPAPGFFEAALASMDCPLKHAVMVGDDAEADVAGALRAGLGGAVLVRTGKYRPGDEERFEPPPTVTLESLSAAVDWILTPTITAFKRNPSTQRCGEARPGGRQRDARAVADVTARFPLMALSGRIRARRRQGQLLTQSGHRRDFSS